MRNFVFPQIFQPVLGNMFDNLKSSRDFLTHRLHTQHSMLLLEENYAKTFQKLPNALCKINSERPAKNDGSNQ